MSYVGLDSYEEYAANLLYRITDGSRDYFVYVSFDDTISAAADISLSFSGVFSTFGDPEAILRNTPTMIRMPLSSANFTSSLERSTFRELSFDLVHKYMLIVANFGKNYISYIPMEIDKYYRTSSKLWTETEIRNATHTRSWVYTYAKHLNQRDSMIKRNPMDIEEFRQLSETLSNKDLFTNSDVDIYQWNRHETISGMLYSKMKDITPELPESDGTDISFEMFLTRSGREFDDFDGMKKTPDFIFELEGKIHILEFTIPGGDSVKAATRKYDKYSSQRLAITACCRTTVELTVVTWTVATNTFYVNDTNITPMVRRSIGMLKSCQLFIDISKFCRGLETKRGYLTALKMFNATAIKDDTNRHEFTSSISLLNNAMIAELNLPTISPTLHNSLHHPGNYSKLRAMGESAIPDRIKNPKEYHESGMMASVRAKLRNSEFPEDIEEMLTQDTGSVVREVDRLLANKTVKVMDHTYPQLVKFPVILKDSEAAIIIKERSWRALDDGTFLIRSKGNVFKDKMYKGPVEGYPICESSLTKFDEVVETLLYTDNHDTSSLCKLNGTRLMQIAESISEISREMLLMDQRRSKGYAALKTFKKFNLYMESSSRGKGDTQYFCKLFVKEAPVFSNEVGIEFSGMSKFDGLGYESKYFSVQMADINHYITLPSRLRVCFSEMSSRLAEEERYHTPIGIDKEIHLFRYAALIMIEHKRNTSNLAQFGRYLVHSFSAVLSDKVNILSEMVSPIRSILQAKIYKQYLLWARYVVTNNSFERALSDMTGDESSNYDKLFVPSLFDTSHIVPFTVTMSEMYYGNLFNPAMGMTAHRDKMSMAKLIQYEGIYRKKVSEDPDSIFGHAEDLFFKKPNYFTMDPEAFATMVDNWLTQPNSGEIHTRALNYALTRSAEHVLKMTRSLVGGPGGDNEMLDEVERTVKTTVFEAIENLVMKCKSASLRMLVAEFPYLTVTLSSFTKDQIGSIREILMQSIKTRVFTAMMNAYFEYLTKFHHKEMIANSEKKADIQSSVVLSSQEEANAYNRKNHLTSSLAVTFSINTDSSKWCLVQLMHWYIILFEKSNLPKPIKMHWVAVISAYANKVVYLPTSLSKKFMNNRKDLVGDEALMTLSKFVDSNGKLINHCGMGEGNIQHGSSFIHCIVDDFVDKMTEFCLEGVATYKATTLITSDDLTKRVSLIVHNTKKDGDVRTTKSLAAWAIKTVLSCNVGVKRIANIHMNMKKSAVQALLTEFNSLFTVSKRTVVAAIKDCYNSVSLVDMTSPEEAVRQCVSNVRRLMEAGSYLGTLKIALEENRKMLMKLYNISSEAEMRLAEKMHITRAELPFQFGFVPTENIFEVLVYGPDIQTAYNLTKYPVLERFYSNVYDLMDISEDDLMSDVTMIHNRKIRLKYRADKQLETLKDRFKENYMLFNTRSMAGMNEDIDSLIINNNKRSSVYLKFMTHMADYIMSVKRTYPFSKMFAMHTTVRAMQMSKGFMYGHLEFTGLDALYEDLAKSEPRKSMLHLLADYTTVAKESEAATKVLDESATAVKARHPKFRKLHFAKKPTPLIYDASEVIQTMFSNTEGIRFTNYNAIHSICEMLAVETNKMMTEPLTSIASKFGDSFHNVLISVVRSYAKLVKDSSVKMVSDYPSTGNRCEEMLQLKAYKTDPREVKIVDFVSMSRLWLRINSNICLFKDEVLFHSSEQHVEVLVPDNQRLKVMAAYFSSESHVVPDRGINWRLIKTDEFLAYRSYYTEKLSNDIREISWINNKGAASMSFNMTTKVADVAYYGARDTLIPNLLAREIIKRRASWVTYRSNSKTSFETCAADEFLVANVRSSRLGAKHIAVVRGSTKWQVLLRFKHHVFTLLTSSYEIDMSDRDNPMVVDLKDLSENPDPKLQEINHFMEQYEVFNDPMVDQTGETASTIPMSLMSLFDSATVGLNYFATLNLDDDDSETEEEIEAEFVADESIVTGLGSEDPGMVKSLLQSMMSLGSNEESVTAEDTFVLPATSILSVLKKIIHKYLRNSITVHLSDLNNQDINAMCSVIYTCLKKKFPAMNDAVALTITSLSVSKNPTQIRARGSYSIKMLRLPDELVDAVVVDKTVFNTLKQWM
jgi:hypothetical protein